MILSRRTILAALGAAPAVAALPRLASASDASALSDQALDAVFAEHQPPAVATA